MKKKLCVLLSCLASLTVSAQELVLRHQLDGVALDTLATQVLRFNDSLKGRGKVLLQDARGVEDKRVLPHLALLDRSDSMDVFATRPRFVPLFELMRSSGQKFNPAQLYPQMLDAVDDSNRKVQALPLGLSLPVLLINRAFLKKAGLAPETAPKTWLDLQKVAGAIYETGARCPLTTSRFAWVHIENVSSQQGEAMLSRVGRSERVNANSLINVKHLALLASWQKSQYFHYDGAGLQGDRRFLSGECAMLTGASSLYADAVRAGMDVGISRLPYYDDMHDAAPADILPDGLALWTLAGHKADEYRLAGRLMSYLMQPEIQKEWVKATGYLPMSPAAVQALRESGIPPHLLDAAERRLSAPLKVSKRLKQGPLRDRLHEFIGEEIGLVWSSDRPAKEALDIAVRRTSAPAQAAAPAPRVARVTAPSKAAVPVRQ